MSLSETGLWLLPLLLVASLVALFLITRHWRKVTQSRLSQLRTQLRQLETTHKGLVQQAELYPVESPPPFTQLAQAIHSRLETLQTELADFKAGYIALQDKLHELNQNRFRALVAAPYLWNELHSSASSLDQQTSAILNLQQESQATLDQLQRLPWEVAALARSASQGQQQLQARLDDLLANQVYGAALETAQNESEQWQAALSLIPAYFLTGSEAEVLKQAEPSGAAEVYSLAQSAQPALKNLSQQAESWQNQRQDAVRQVSQLQNLLSGLQRLFSEMPEALELTALRTQYDRMLQVAQNLEATLGRLEIESTATLVEETLRQQQACASLERELRQARQQLGSLNKTLPELDTALDQVSELFESLASSPVHPIRWGASRTELEEQYQRAAALHQHQAPHPIDRVRRDLEAATQLLVDVKLLDQQTRATAEGHAELLRLLESPELASDQRWLEGARSLPEKVAIYDPVNWPRLDGTAHLQEDLQEFSTQLQQLTSQGTKKALPESELMPRLEEARRLARNSNELRSRTIKIQSRLEEIQTQEQYCRQQLDEGTRILAQITALERSNDALAKVVHADLSRLDQALKQAQVELDQRYRGSIEKKVRTAESFTSRLDHSLRQWQALFGKEIEAAKQGLAEQITALQAIAELDEPAVQAARQLLASPAANATNKAGAGYDSSSSEIILDIKRSCEFWQSCQAARSGLADVAQPVVELFQEASRHRNNARQMLTSQAESVKGTENWLPGGTYLEDETQEYARLEGIWSALHSQPLRAMPLVNQLGKLAARYEGLAERIQQTSVKATQGQAQLVQLEKDLDELAGKWEALWQAYRDNPVPAEEIRKLLADIDGERDLLQRQFRQGERSFGEVLYTLQQLQRRARLTQVMIDERTALDINGRVIPYK